MSGHCYPRLDSSDPDGKEGRQRFESVRGLALQIAVFWRALDPRRRAVRTRCAPIPRAHRPKSSRFVEFAGDPVARQGGSGHGRQLLRARRCSALRSDPSATAEEAARHVSARVFDRVAECPVGSGPFRPHAIEDRDAVVDVIVDARGVLSGRRRARGRCQRRIVAGVRGNPLRRRGSRMLASALISARSAQLRRGRGAVRWRVASSWRSTGISASRATTLRRRAWTRRSVQRAR